MAVFLESCRMTSIRWLGCLAVVAVLLTSAESDRSSADGATVKVVLPVPPGGAGDIIARLLTDQVGRAQKRTFLIETRPGAGTMIGTEAVRTVPADRPPFAEAQFRSAHEPGADLLSRQFAGCDRRQRV